MTKRKTSIRVRPDLGARPGIEAKNSPAVVNKLIESNLKSIVEKIYKDPLYNKVPAVGFGVVLNGSIFTQVHGVRKYKTKMSIQPDDLFALGSIGKPLTGYLFATYSQKVAKLRAKGFFTTINDIYPEFIKTYQNNAKKGIGPDYSNFYSNVTVAQMMAHVSGFDYMPQYNHSPHFHNYPKNHEELLRKVKSTNTFIDMTPADIIEKRKFYSQIALSDPPYGGWDLRNNNNTNLIANNNSELVGNSSLFKYSGGCIVVASMMEKVSKRSWEQLMTTHVFNPLKISKFRYLGTSKNDNFGLPTGNHQHIVRNQKIESFDISPQDITQQQITHRPAGVPAMSMLDFGKWIRAVIDMYNTKDTGNENAQKIKNDYFKPVQTSGFTKGGWISFDGKEIWHNGSNGWNYSLAKIHLDRNYGYFVFTNIDTPEARALNNEISAELDRLCKEERLRTLPGSWVNI